MWHHDAGDALRLRLSADGIGLDEHVLGTDLASGAQPQTIVQAGQRQAAEPLDEWTFVGCTVAPGFNFAPFELAPPNWQPGS